MSFILYNRFSESLLEIITPPFSESSDLINFLEKSHQYVSQSINNEKLWPASMPPNFHDDDIQIAKYGVSNIAKFKPFTEKVCLKDTVSPWQFLGCISIIHFLK